MKRIITIIIAAIICITATAQFKTSKFEIFSSVPAYEGSQMNIVAIRMGESNKEEFGVGFQFPPKELSPEQKAEQKKLERILRKHGEKPKHRDCSPLETTAIAKERELSCMTIEYAQSFITALKELVNETESIYEGGITKNGGYIKVTTKKTNKNNIIAEMTINNIPYELDYDKIPEIIQNIAKTIDFIRK